MRARRKPPWWRVLAVLLLLKLGLLALAHYVPLSPRQEQVAQVAVVVLVYGLLGVWMQANAETIDRDYREVERRAPAGRAGALEPHRRVPPVTPRQAHYRRVMDWRAWKK